MNRIVYLIGVLALIGAFSSSAAAESYLKVDFRYNTSGKTATFTDQSAGMSIVEWRWTFGDRNVSYEQNPAHTFPGYGTYNVTLTVINANGELHTAAKNIVLSPGTLSPYLSMAFVIPLILVIVGVGAVGLARNDYARLGAIVVIIMGVYFLVA
mgnify:CR=1 FL=1